METSRLFVRGLPPNLTEDELRSHFAQTAPVTDAKLISHRRLGYVGYKTPADAARALRFHDRTFVRMAKISVEYARSIADRRRDASERQGASHSGAHQREGDNVDPQLQEFLETMKPSRSRVWENDPGGLDRMENPAAAPESDQPGHVSDEEYEPLPKRRKVDPGPVARPQEKADAGDLVTETGQQPPTVDPAASDADWLRTRTSRLLELAEEDGESDVEEDNQPIKGGSRTKQAETSMQKATSDAGSQTGNDLHEPVSTADTAAFPSDQTPIDDRRLFIRNLSYQTSQDDLRDYFATFGALEEAHLPRHSSGSSKGFAFVLFEEASAASAAIIGTNAIPFQGRLLHVMPANAKRSEAVDEFAVSKLPHKQQQQVRRKAAAAAASFRWNTLFMNADAVMASTAAKLGVSKAEILDPTSASAAVQQAHAETNIIQETKNFFQSNGVNIESFGSRQHSDTVILVKNFAYGTSNEELRQLFKAHGEVKRLLMPPAGTMAIVEMGSPEHTRKAFSALAYRKLGDSVLFLEKAPRNVFDGKVVGREIAPEQGVVSTGELLATEDPATPSATLFVKNLNFETTNATLYETFRPLQGFMSARVKMKPDTKRTGVMLSMGFGFVEFRSTSDAQAALAAMDGYILDGHRLQLKSSHKALDAAEERRREDAAKKAASRHTKIIIKNLPFEAEAVHVRELFRPYGKLRSIRVPKKIDSSTRGFAFADFVTVKEAQNALEALAGVHLLGRRLNLEYAAEEAVDPEQEIEAMSKKVGRQVDKVAARQLTSTGRKKFSVQSNEEDGSFD